MKEKFFEAMYEEVYDGFGDTLEYENAKAAFCDNVQLGESNQNFDLLVGAVNAECKQAFRSGFYVAVSILMGGVQ